MRSYLKIAVTLLVADPGFLPADEAGKAPEPEKTPAVAAPQAAPKADKGKDRLDFPVPKGQPQKGLHVPLYSPGGKLMMNFHIGVATWMDDDNIKMGELKVATFKEDGAPEFDIDLSESMFNIRTKELNSDAHVTIRRDDFQISSNSMTFNTETKVGKFGGGVKMTVFNARAAAGEKGAAAAQSSPEVKPAKEEKK